MSSASKAASQNMSGGAGAGSIVSDSDSPDRRGATGTGSVPVTPSRRMRRTRSAGTIPATIMPPPRISTAADGGADGLDVPLPSAVRSVRWSSPSLAHGVSSSGLGLTPWRAGGPTGTGSRVTHATGATATVTGTTTTWTTTSSTAREPLSGAAGVENSRAVEWSLRGQR